MTVSICIPTYNRPNLLLEAINSCLQQSVLPYEILIGDDSKNNDTKNVIEKFISVNVSGVTIRYFKNEPSLKQTLNVNTLFKAVTGDKLILLHDDDLLLPNAIELMVNCFQNNDIDVCFGKQYSMNEGGVIDYEGSIAGNAYYFKSPEYGGAKLSSIDVVLSHQFPNDGFMIDSAFANKVEYADEKASDACDFIFAYKLGLAGCRFYFIDEYTSVYRNTAISISSQGGDASYIIYNTIYPYTYKPVNKNYKHILLNRHVRQAIVQAVQLKQKKTALKMFFSKHHLPFIFSGGGVKRLMYILFK